MFSRLREHFGSAGLVVAIIALVVVLAGVAAAANGGGGGKAAASKGKQGPRGKTGKTGPAGPAGPSGAVGPAGPEGPAGLSGEDGDRGKDGKSGTNGINGTDGEPGPIGPVGPEGSPWTDGGTLPPGETETGAWGGFAIGLVVIPISFTLPLPASLGEPQVHFVKSDGTEEGAPSTQCKGSAAEPSAEPGNLCVYAGIEMPGFNENIKKPYGGGEITGAGTSGALVFALAEPGVPALGTWAVTAPE